MCVCVCVWIHYLQGATRVDQTTIPEGSEQIFVMSENVTNTEKEDLAWATYILLRNTNTIAVVWYLRIIQCLKILCLVVSCLILLIRV